MVEGKRVVIELELEAGKKKKKQQQNGVGNSNRLQVIEEISGLEKRIFPKHESLASGLLTEMQRRNSGLLYALSLDPHNIVQHNGVDAEDDGAEGSGDASPPAAVVVVGYVMYSFTSSLAASITKLAVREAFRRQGFGEALLRAALEKCHARRVLCVNLHVDPTRIAAVALYKKIGFEIDTLIQSYYAPRRDAYRMVLSFDKD
ncbi:hypothetical protein O6H91_14G061700 [Diphasiastrum complanatum]|uniref:Uncharacterized protein n=1 Tax=Diphasiastrum complanatum TaxID=34168 RepID=A0ACC2BQ38_DIPCM|nr:hypothetical protein O6H91_14G061700 [Diphasiastrum complanatum]